MTADKMTEDARCDCPLCGEQMSFVCAGKEQPCRDMVQPCVRSDDMHKKAAKSVHVQPALGIAKAVADFLAVWPEAEKAINFCIGFADLHGTSYTGPNIQKEIEPLTRLLGAAP